MQLLLKFIEMIGITTFLAIIVYLISVLIALILDRTQNRRP